MNSLKIGYLLLYLGGFYEEYSFKENNTCYYRNFVDFYNRNVYCICNNVVKSPLKTDSDKITIEVNEGEGFYNLLDRLNNEGVIKNETLIKVNLKLTNQDLEIIPGSYEVDSDVTLKELIKMLTTEDFLKNQVKVTIKEGYTIDTIADVIAESGICTRDEFINEVKNYPLPDYVKADSNKKYNLEGYLFPDTYFFDKNFHAKSMIKLC